MQIKLEEKRLFESEMGGREMKNLFAQNLTEINSFNYNPGKDLFLLKKQYYNIYIQTNIYTRISSF